MIRKLSVVSTVGIGGAILLLALGAWLSEQGWAGTRHLLGFSGVACTSTSVTERQRTLTFDPTDTLIIDLPASVHFQTGDTPKAIISGDPSLVANVKIENGKLSLDCDPGWFTTEVNVDLSGPPIADWKMTGKTKLSLSAISQQKLQLEIDGSGSVDADGAVDTVVVLMSGSSAARLKGLIAKSVDISIRGNGAVQATATTDAAVSIIGNGNVELAGHPAMRQSDIIGNGRIVHLN